MRQAVEQQRQIDAVELAKTQPAPRVGDVGKTYGDQSFGRDLFRAFLGASVRGTHAGHAYRIPRLVRSS